MRKYIIRFCVLIGVSILFSNCSEQKKESHPLLVHKYDNILDISYTPNDSFYCSGWFSDQGAWMGFTVPQKERWINGFCGPFDLETRRWISQSLVTVGFAEAPDEVFSPDSVVYFPGELYMRSSSGHGTISQRLFFIDKSNVLLECVSDSNKPLCFYGQALDDNSSYSVVNNSCMLSSSSGDQYLITFPENVKIHFSGNRYEANVSSASPIYVVISSLENIKGQMFDFGAIAKMQSNPSGFINKHYQCWNGYLEKVLRSDMPEEYDRIAVKAVVTLIANWRSSRAGLLHDGVVPSHAVGYFMGFWAWDSWKHAAALADFAPELAKNQVRAMFDYQMDNGMIID